MSFCILHYFFKFIIFICRNQGSRDLNFNLNPIMPTIKPVQATEREQFMDVLRGFAIFGIFIANLYGFTWYEFVTPESHSAWLLPHWDSKMFFLHHLFVEGKFYSIFSFLFGWGVAIQLYRAEEKGLQTTYYIRRRLFFMLLLGAIHLLLWPGDIVFLYAMLGFLLLFFRRFSNKALIWLSVLFVLSPIILYALKMHFRVLNYPSEVMFRTGGMLDAKIIHVNSDESFRAYIRNAGWLDILKADIPGFFYRYGDLFFQSRFPKVLGLMLLGLAAGRSNFYKRRAAFKKTLLFIAIAGIAWGFPANFMLARSMQEGGGSYYGYAPAGLYRTIYYAIGVAPLAAAYIALFMLAYDSYIGKKIGNLFSPVGKMAFTNYIMQTLIGNFVFLHAGLGYMEKVGPVYYTLFGMIVFVCQVIFSRVWLRYFNYGPLEWLWRSATYHKWQPLVKNKDHLDINP